MSRETCLVVKGGVYRCALKEKSLRYLYSASSSSSSSNDRYRPRHHLPYTVGPPQYYKHLKDCEDEDSWRQAETGDAEDRHTLVTMLQVATRSDSVPAVTRHKLVDNILAMFDQRSQIIAHLVQVTIH